MAATSSTAIVPQILDIEHDYKDWSVHVKTYLLSKDLWDVVETTSKPPEQEDDFKVWRKNNAEALHAIQLSCGPRNFPSIRDKTTAKAAWDTLEEQFNREESSDEIPHDYQAFFTAVKRGDWDKTEEFLTQHPNARTVMNSHGTALHNAVLFEQEQIAEKLVELMSVEDLEIRARDGSTALVPAAIYNLKIVKCMVTKNKKLLGIATNDGMTPILMAAMSDRWNIVRYLYAFTPHENLTPDKGPCGSELVSCCLFAKKFDIALDLLQNCPRLAYTQSNIGSPISAFARMPSAFPSGVSLKFWQRWIYNCIHVERARSTIDFRINVQNQENEQGNQKNSKDLGLLQGLPSRVLDLLGITRIRELKLIHDQSCQILDHMCDAIKQLNYEEMKEYGLDKALFLAVKTGIPELVMSLGKVDIELLAGHDTSGKIIFQYAVECRQEKVYSLIYGAGQRNLITAFQDYSGNSILHCAGVLSPWALARLNGIPGAALQMQRERQWYKEVERIFFQLSVSTLENKYGLTPPELFTKSHEKMHKEGEKWMKVTASSYTVVSTLIITIMFAAAFTVPGGNNQETGFPIFLNEKLFMVFIVSDAISLFSSATSVLMFLGILTSRYAEDDFLKSLPTKMIIGLSTLFISIATMMVAFSSALFIMLRDKPWITYPIIFLAGVPVILYVWMQFPLLVDIFVSTYGGGIFDRKVKRWI